MTLLTEPVFLGAVLPMAKKQAKPPDPPEEKKGRGRPRTGRKPILHVSVAHEVMSDLQLIKDGLGIPKEDIVRSLLTEHLPIHVQRAKESIARRNQIRGQAEQSDE